MGIDFKVNWLIDETVNESGYDTGFPTLAEAAKSLGYEVYLTKYRPFSSAVDPDIPFPEGSCVVTHGSIEFCKQVIKFRGRDWIPGVYFNDNTKYFRNFAPQIGDDLLNSDYYIIPYAEFVRRKLINVFIKPEYGLKSFVGQVFDGDFQKLSPWGEIDPLTLVVVAEPKKIKAEFRYIICDKKVITGSEYRWDNVLDVRRDTHPICDALAQKIAEAEWQADRVYVCDVALLEQYHDGNFDKIEVAKVVELNAFSSSGLYACDTVKIVEAVSQAAWNEYGYGEAYG